MDERTVATPDQRTQRRYPMGKPAVVSTIVLGNIKKAHASVVAFELDVRTRSMRVTAAHISLIRQGDPFIGGCHVRQKVGGASGGRFISTLCV